MLASVLLILHCMYLYCATPTCASNRLFINCMFIVGQQNVVCSLCDACPHISAPLTACMFTVRRLGHVRHMRTSSTSIELWKGTLFHIHIRFILTCKRDTKLHATLPVTVTNSANRYQDAANVTFIEQNITFVLQRAEKILAFNRAKININIIWALINRQTMQKL